MSERKMPRWPLAIISLPAAVAIWSGWVGLGQLCGFGLVTPLPGIVNWHLNTAITLPVGVEAYGTFALAAWLSPAGVPERARAFARKSAIGALLLGMSGQVLYHLLAAAHSARAPWPVVVLVACLPVVTLGFGASLTHLLRAPGETERVASESGPETAPVPALEVHPEPAPAPVAEVHPQRTRKASRTRTRTRTPSAPEVREAAEREFLSEIASGAVPSLRDIRSRLHVGQDRAQEVQAHLGTLVRT